MDKDKNIVDSFANVLKNRHYKEQYVSLYGENKTLKKGGSNVAEDYAIEDVISGVAKQLKAIQYADNTKNCSYRKYTSRTFQKSHFQPVDMLSFKQEPKQMQSNKFDTQCVSDTQLIDMIEDAEALINVRKGITQEFDTTFFKKDLDIDRINNKVKKCVIETDSCNQIVAKSPISNNIKDLNNDTFSPIKKQDIANLSFSNESVCTLENDIKYKNADVCVSSDECFIESHKDKIIEDPNSERNNIKVKETGNSILIENQSDVKLITPSPLIFELESFEKFETFALPIIKENHDDFETAKKVINSQIMHRELFIHCHAEPVLSDRDKDLSPVLKNTIKFNSEMLQVNYENMDIKLKSLNEDSMLFSSDEENDAENPLDQSPLTCTLQVSLYDKPAILDKTMYVGFQTASNKSIQICTDSFSKAKCIFNEANKIDIELESAFVQAIDDDFDSNRKHLSCDKNVAIKNNNEVNTDDHLVNHTDSISSIISSKTLKSSNNMHENNDKTSQKEKINNSIQSLQHDQLNFNHSQIKDTLIQETMIQRHVSINAALNDRNKVVEQLYDSTKDTFRNKSFKHLEQHTNIEHIEIENEKLPSIGKKVSTNFVGFRTANNDVIKISAEAYIKTKNVFENIDSDKLLPEKSKMDNFENLAPLKAVNSMSCFNTKTNKCFFNPLISKNLDSAYSLNITNSMNSDSKFISINHNNDINSKDLPINESLSKNILSNRTHSQPKKFIPDKISCDSKLEKYHNDVISTPVEQYKLNTAAHDSSPSYAASDLDINFILQNFKTANEKPVKVCNESLAKPKHIFNNLDINNINTAKNFDCHEYKLLIEESSHQAEVFQGFRTASNKPVQISERAFTKTKNIFQDIVIEESTTVNEEMCSLKIPLLNNVVASDKFQSPQISGNALHKFKNIHKDVVDVDMELQNVDKNYVKHTSLYPVDNMIPKTPLQGFKTASNKPVEISEKALSRTKRIFKDIGFEDDNETKTTNEYNIMSIEKQHLPETYKTSNSIFHGFKTASKKPVEISIEALARSKKLFQDMDIVCDEKCLKNMDGNVTENQVERPARSSNILKRLKSASEGEIKLSGNALLNTINDFKGVDLDLNNSSSNNRSPINKLSLQKGLELKNANNIQLKVSEEALKETRKLNDKVVNSESNILDESFFNTEVIKDFEETLCTENFINSDTLNSKRSGSPILPCPRAKKRKKFETPITTKRHIKLKDTNSNVIVYENLYRFDQNYKKNKTLSLKDLNSIENSGNDNTDPYILYFQFETLLDFEFTGVRNDIDNNKWTTDKIKRFFTDSVNRKIIPDGWIENHLKLILWKLISYEIRFPQCMRNVCTVTNVLDQLKYRYDRELYNVERPALRKILEKDEVSTRTMILCVASVYVDGMSVSRINNDAQNIELLLTDGWYTVKASTDRMIDKLVCNGKITVGTKLVIHGAELLNCDEGISPWEDTSSVRLKISGNSTRRAKWDARLGFHSNAPILTNLSAVKPEGGKISRLTVYVTRVYPVLYVEKFPDGSTLTRSERLETIHQTNYETVRQLQIEKIYDEMEKLSDQESQDSEGVDDGAMDTGSQISRMMKRSRDCEGFRENLTKAQAHLLHQHTIKRKEKILQHFQTKFQELVKERGLDVQRSVVPLMKIRVADVEKEKNTKAMITIWRSNELLQELVKEGMWLDIYNVVPTSVRYSEIQISAGRQSIFRKSKIKEADKLKTYTQTLKRRCYSIKDLQNPAMNTDYNEIDTVGIIFLIDPAKKDFELKNQPFQNVYLCDADKNMICVNFWGGIKKFGFEIILGIGEVIACVNLQKRAGNRRQNIPQFRATELSYFTKTPKMDTIRRSADDLASKFYGLDKRKFIDDCIALKNNFHIIKCGNIENVTPYRLNSSDYNIHKNKVFIDSPLVNKCTDENYNLTGLDFETTFKRTDTQELSPQMLVRKRQVDEKIARLKMYGEPPPLSPIHLINKSNNAVNQFKSPLTKFDISSSVTNVNILPHNNGDNIKSSPILNLNRTYVKRPSMNPVKLNFNSVIDDECKHSNVDPFAEEFDGSQPLSLD